MPRKARRGNIGELDDINLVPIMSILVILIPMLIYAFTFFEVTVQSVAAPKMGTGKSKAKDDQDQKKPLNLTVLISDDGFVVKYDDDSVTEPEAPIKRREFPADKEHGADPFVDYDYPALYNRLKALKTRYPNEEQINIGAQMHIPWKVMARTIDCARLTLNSEDAFEGDDAMPKYMAAKPKLIKNDPTNPELMFPNVVFVVAD